MSYVVQVSYFVSTENHLLFDIVIAVFLFMLFNVYNKSYIITVACLSGSYGESCTKRCGINCRRCNNVNGLCDSGCKPGWTGIVCEQSRIYNSYIFTLFYCFYFWSCYGYSLFIKNIWYNHFKVCVLRCFLKS